MTANYIEQRTEPRVELKEYHCIEVQTLKTLFLYQFKIWNISSHGMCLIIKSESGFLNNVDVGEILDAQYYPADLSWPPDILKTKIMHITKANPEKFKDHFLVGLRIVE